MENEKQIMANRLQIIQDGKGIRKGCMMGNGKCIIDNESWYINTDY